MMGNLAEKVLCDLKDHRQHGLTYFDESLTLEIKNQYISKLKKPWSSSVTSANAMPTLVLVFYSQVVFIFRLICSNEGVYEEIIFCKTKLS